MSESLPDPVLPIFGDSVVVSYNRLPDHDERWQTGERQATMSVSVDEIDGLHDPLLRKALWNKLKVQQDPRARRVHFVTVNPDGSYHSEVSAPRGELRFPTVDAEIEVDVPAPVSAHETAYRRLFSRIFGE